MNQDLCESSQHLKAIPIWERIHNKMPFPAVSCFVVKMSQGGSMLCVNRATFLYSAWTKLWIVGSFLLYNIYFRWRIVQFDQSRKTLLNHSGSLWVILIKFKSFRPSINSHSLQYTQLWTCYCVCVYCFCSTHMQNILTWLSVHLWPEEEHKITKTTRLYLESMTCPLQQPGRSVWLLFIYTG